MTTTRETQARWDQRASSSFGGAESKLSVSDHDRGWPTARMTERSVGLALADRWMGPVDRGHLYEVGAVTPHYWPCRVPNVVDPHDEHPLVTIRSSHFDVDPTDRAVLSISTLEHVGMGDYGLPRDGARAVAAFEKPVDESPRFRVTVPLGLNKYIDLYITDSFYKPDDVSICHTSGPAAGTTGERKPTERK